MRFNSHINMRIQIARGGNSNSSRVSVAAAKANSLNSGEA